MENHEQRTPKWVTITEMAGFAGVTLGCVTNWIARGKIAVKPGCKHGARLVDRNTAPAVNTYNAGKTL